MNDPLLIIPIIYFFPWIMFAFYTVKDRKNNVKRSLFSSKKQKFWAKATLITWISTTLLLLIFIIYFTE